MPAGLLASALLLGLYARGGAAWPLGFVALVPWLLVQDRLASLRGTLLASLGMAVAFVAAVFGWFAPAVAAYTGWPSALAFAALLLLAPVLQPQILAHALVRRRVPPARVATRATLATAAWLATEWAVPRLFGDTLGHGLHPSPLLRQAADVAGPAGLTLALLLVNEAIAAAIARRRQGARACAMPLAFAAAVPALLAGYGAWRLATLERETAGTPLRIALVQADITDYERLRREMGGYAVVRHVLDTHYGLSARARREHAVDAVVWPETVYPTTFMAPKSADGAQLDAEVLGFVRGLGVPLVFGTYDRDDAGEYNAAAFVDPQRGAIGRYRKTRLFPLTESVPASIDGPLLRRALPWAGTWRPGDGARVFPLATADGREVPVVPLICRDDVEPALALDGARLGAQLIVGLSNDAWFTAAPQGARLHLVVAAFRSIETRLPQVRATTNGLSAVVDPTGEIVSRTRMGERTVLVATVAPREAARTPVMAWGPWLGPASVLVLGVGAVLALHGRWRGRRGARDATDPADTAGPWRVALLTPPMRAAVAVLRLLSRGGVLALGAIVLFADEPLGRLQQIRVFAALVLAPELLAAVLLWRTRGSAAIEAGQLVLDTARRRVEIPLRSLVAARPWRLPLPSPGLDLQLATGGRWLQGLALRDPDAITARLIHAGAPVAAERPVGRVAAWQRALARPTRRWDHPVAKFLLFPLVPALPAFRLHQHIAYGGTFGEAYTFGIDAWLLALALWWASWAVALVLVAGGLRLFAEAGTLLAFALRPARAPGVRAMLLAVTRLVYYVGIPLWLGLRLTAG